MKATYGRRLPQWNGSTMLEPASKLELQVGGEIDRAPATEEPPPSPQPRPQPRQRTGTRRCLGSSRYLAEDGAGVLDIVVERSIDVGNLACRQRHQGKPVIVELPTGPIREGERRVDLDVKESITSRRKRRLLATGGRVPDLPKRRTREASPAPSPGSLELSWLYRATQTR